jgi:hypothetical protein
MQPITVRGVFYQATAHRLVEKEESGYRKTLIELINIRRTGTCRMIGLQITFR